MLRILKQNIIAVSLRSLNKILNRKYRMRSVGMVVLIMFNSLLNVFSLISILPFISIILDTGLIHSNRYLRAIYQTFNFDSDNQFILFMVISLFVLFMIKNLTSLLIARIQALFSFNLSRELSRRFFLTYLSKDLLFIQNVNSNKIARDIVRIPGQFATQIVLSLISIFSESVILLLILVGITIYNVEVVFLLLLVIAPVFLLMFITTKKKMKKLEEDMNDIFPMAHKSVYQTVFAYRDVKLANKDLFFLADYSSYLDKIVSINAAKYVLRLVPSKALETTIFLGLVVFVVYGLFILQDLRGLVGLLTLFAVSAYKVIPSINAILLSMLSLKGFQYIFDRMEELDLIDSKKLDEYGKNFEGKMQFNDRLNLKDLSFTYPGKDEFALQHLNLEILKGDKIGIIGESGSGKSTLINILLRFLKESSGEMLVDNKKIETDRIPHWRNIIGYVPQDVFILDGTIAENIAFGIKDESIDHQKMTEALDLASLSSFTNKLKDGIYTQIGERGTRISGGQRQRIGIARALYNESEILILDEATSSLDYETEQEITNSIRKLNIKELTIIIIAHRITTLKHCNRILEMKNGKIFKEYDYEEVKKKIVS